MAANRSSVCGIVVLIALAPSAFAATWTVAPGGTPAGQGTRQSPWDIASALAGKHPVPPGDVIELLGGTYRRRPQEQFEVKLVGAEGKPITVRPAPGERATIDGGLLVLNPSAHVWIRDLEILVSEPNPDHPVEAGSHPEAFKRPWGGLNVQGGDHCKYIDLVIHNCRQGVSWWSGEHDGELYGCLIYDNGWPATDRGHGHAIYTQNNEGTKTVADNIMTGGYGYSLHAYGSSRADVNHYLVEGNICYACGPFLIGGGRPSRDIRVFGNYLHGTSMQIGYDAPYNGDCEVRDNLIVNGGLKIVKYRKAVNEGNTILGKADPRPAGARVILRPNRYDPDRANVAIFNWAGGPTVSLDAAKFLKPGDRFRLRDPKNFFGKPVLEGTFGGRPIEIPVKGEFAAFVLLRRP